jgi:hypothetical protein
MASTSLDRLVRKEVSLGAIRQKQPPMDHIGLAQISPFLEVGSDDVIFDYIKGGVQEGLAPARAEDAESELSQKDEISYGQGRASVIDWSLKDRYTASDVTRYREDLIIQQQLAGTNTQLNLNFSGRTAADFEKRVARHDTLRRRKLDNRLEWLIMQSIETSQIAYNDGKIKFTVPWGRPADQQDQTPASGAWDAGTNADFDPIGDILEMQQTMYDRYGVRPKRAITSQKVLNRLWTSTRFLARFGIVVGGTPNVPIDPNYLGTSFGPDVAVNIVEQQTGVKFVAYDSVYQTRAIGTTNTVNTRFLSENKIVFLPNEADLGEIDDTEIGFSKTLTSPHPEGNWTPGYYEWEDETKDPWGQVRGSGIKAFPVFPYMEYTYTMEPFS